MKIGKRLALLLLCLALMLLALAGLSMALSPDIWLEQFSPALETPAPTAEPTPTLLPTPTPTPVPMPEPTPSPRPRTELLTLVNPWNKLSEDPTPELVLVNDEGDEWQYVDARCADALMDMIYDCYEAGNAPYICSGYRTLEKQQYLFNNKIARLIAEGVAPEEAPALAAMSVAVPGTSEHQLGLAVDIIDYYYPYLNQSQEYTTTQQWLMENSWRYGFILRYPSDKSDITGIIYEPWHYRYVGLEEATEMYELGLTLEEYLDMFYEAA